jgi:hypothetical protein
VAQNRTNLREKLLSQSVACAVVYGIPNGPPARPAPDGRSATRSPLTAPPRIKAPRRAASPRDDRSIGRPRRPRALAAGPYAGLGDGTDGQQSDDRDDLAA